MKINPVYQKELKVAVRTPRFAVKIVAYNLVLAVITILAYYASFGAYYQYYSQNYYNVIVIFIITAVIEMGLIVFAVPSITAGSIAGEREKQTLDILLSTTLKPREIILGKLLSSISLMLLLFLSSLPILAMVFSIGGVQPKALLQLIILAVSTAIYIGSIGIFFSTKMKKSVPATVATYVVTLIILFGTFVIIYGVYFFIYAFWTKETVGILVILLLINPVMSGVAMMNGQFGSDILFSEYIDSMGYCPSFIIEHWFVCSIVLQLLIGVLFLYLATKALNPLRIRRKKRERKPIEC